MNAFLVVLLLTSLASAADLQGQLESMVQRHRGKVALYAKQLKTGATVAINADTPVPTASVIKLPIMVEAFAQIKAGKNSLSEKVVLDEPNQTIGSGVLGFLRPGVEMTLEDAIVLMIIVSDNTATNLVIDHVTIPAVNARMAAMGLKNTHLYKKVGKPVVGPAPADQKRFGLGKTTAREMAAVMESVYRCDLGDPKLCQRMLEILRNQQYRNMIPRFLETIDFTEAPSAIMDKTGDLDQVRNDVALVETNDGPIIISAFTRENQDQRWTPENEAYLLLGRMAEVILKAWAPHGLKKYKAPK
ncbi:MAG TPA: serine hydrolase [Terriglobales bacterium]|nr:serine hydrolase [Terriglobales bacterium]